MSRNYESRLLGQGVSTPSLTPNAMAVLSTRYLPKNADGKAAETPAQLFRRVAEAVASAETQYGLSAEQIRGLAGQFYGLMAGGVFLPNSPTLMNAGRASGMLSACFVLPIEDSIESIFAAVKSTALIQKAGGGTGFSFSRLRPKGDPVGSSGGVSSGPVSFIEVISAASNAIQQGAFRRGANMGVVRVDHPDIMEFVNVKQTPGTLSNFNLSVAMPDSFIDQLRKSPSQAHTVRNPRNGETRRLLRSDGAAWSVDEVFSLIVQRAWETGEPGLIFIDRINQANTTPCLGEIEATNPCGEQPLLAYESCTLGSINLSRFVSASPTGRGFDFDAFGQAVRLAVRFLDNAIDINRYPLPEIEAMSRASRKIGLGVMGFADTLFALGILYNSDAGLEFGEKVMGFMRDESHQASEHLAGERGCFPSWEGSVWKEQGMPMRNACTTTVAPTGTISIIAGCTSGIEPAFSLAFYRNILDGKRLLEVNATFEKIARDEGFYSVNLIERMVECGSIQGMTEVPEDIRRVFVTAHDIAPEWHVRMQAAFQKNCDSGVSKTVNLRHDAAVEDVRRAFLMAFELACKGITVYRDGCRKNQPMALAEKRAAGTETAKPATLPDIMPAIRVKERTPLGNMHVKIVVDPVTGQEREVFAQLGKGGDLANSDLEAVCRLISLYLRIDGAFGDVIAQLSGIGSSLSIPTSDGRVTSLADGLAKALQKYARVKQAGGLQNLLLGKTDCLGDQHETNSSVPLRSAGADAAFKIKCPNPECGSVLVFEDGCAKCHRCGYAQC